MGNPRFDLYLRHSDLNRIHLLLLESLRFRNDSIKIGRIFAEFRRVFRSVRPWLEKDANSMLQAATVFQKWSERHLLAGEPSAKDAASRLASESRRHRKQSDILRRLLAVPMEEAEWRVFVRSGFDITELIPKGYFGPPNSLDQLARYVVGWLKPPEERWLQPDQALFRTLDYPQLFASYQALNPDIYGNRYPFNYFVTGVPVDRLIDPEGPPLRQALWLLASGNRGQAAILEAKDGTMWYSPLKSLDRKQGLYRLRPSNHPDPLKYPQRLWSRWLDPRRWVLGTAELESSLAPIILLELFRKNFESFLTGSQGRSVLIPFDSANGRQEQIRALRFRFDQSIPDCRVWMRQGWNVNTMGQQPAGSHGGFLPLETQIAFMAWGGGALGLRRGVQFSGAYLTLDIMPTLLDAIGRFDHRNRRIISGSGPPFRTQLSPLSRPSDADSVGVPGPAVHAVISMRVTSEDHLSARGFSSQSQALTHSRQCQGAFAPKELGDRRS